MHEVDENLIMVLFYEASEHASESLSILMDQSVKIDTGLVTRSLNLDLPAFSKDREAYVVRLDIKGDILGTAAIILDPSVAKSLADWLNNRSLNNKNTFDEEMISALKETGNIIMGSYLTVFSNRLKLKLVEYLPILTKIKRSEIPNMLLEILSKGKGVETWSVEILFNFVNMEFRSELVLAFNTENLVRIVQALNEQYGEDVG